MKSYDSQAYIAFLLASSSILVPAVSFHFHFSFGLLTLLKQNKVLFFFFLKGYSKEMRLEQENLCFSPSKDKHLYMLPLI